MTGMEKLRQTVAAVLTVCLLAVSVSWPYRADQALAAQVSGDFTYSDQGDGTVEIVSYTGTALKLDIPEQLGGKNVTSIKSGAFDQCKTLQEITIPSGITSLGMNTPFTKCPALTAIHVAAGNQSYASDDGVLFNKDQTKLIRCPQGKAGAYTVPSGVTTTGQLSFTNCTELTEVTLADSVATIGVYAFLGCGKLAAVRIGSGAINIDTDAFNDCTSLTDIRVDDGNTRYASTDGVLYTKDRTNLIRCPQGKTGVSFADELQVITEYSFYNCGRLTAVTIPDSVQTGKDAFSYCTGLTKFSFAQDAGDIPENVLAHCTSLTDVFIPYSISTVGGSAFEGCSALQDVWYSGTQNQWDTLVNDAGMNTTGNETLLRATMHYESTMPGESQVEYEYTQLDASSVRITTYLGSEEVVDIPAEIDGKRVTSIGENLFQGCQIRQVRIPDSVTSIETRTLGEGSGWTSILVSGDNPVYASLDGVLYSKDHTTVLKYPEGLGGSYEIPAGVTRIGEWAFSNCSALERVTVPRGVTELGEGAFASCNGLTSVSLPDSVTAIGRSAFAYSTGLTSVTMPKGVNTIGDSAFAGCTSILNVVLPDRMSIISNELFAGCIGLTSVTLPGALTEVGRMAFGGCSNLADVTYPGTQAEWNQITIGSDNDPLLGATMHFEEEPEETGNYEYRELTDSGTAEITKYKGAGTEIRVPQTLGGKAVTSIGDDAFKNCTTLTKVIIPDGIKRIGDGAFSGCVSLKEIELSASVTELDTTFTGCEALVSFHVDTGNPQYASDEGVLYHKDKKTLLRCPPAGKSGVFRIPSGVTTIGPDAFAGCAKLTEIVIPSSVTDISGDIFIGCGALKNIQTETANPAYMSDEGVLFNKKKTTLLRCPPAGKSGMYHIPSTVTAIESSAFRDCGQLTEVVMPSGVGSIGNASFSGCGALKKVIIPEGVKQPGWYAFQNCTSLEEVIIPESVESILYGCFGGCTALKKISIPKGVSTIMYGAFRDCTGLMEIELPVSMTSIDEAVFQGCHSLKNVYYAGAKEQWDNITIHNEEGGNAPLVNAAVHYTDGDFRYTVSADGTATITGYTGKDTQVILPDRIGDTPVTSVGAGAFAGCTFLTDITVPEGITSIGAEAMKDCGGLTKVTLPAGLEEIAQDAFAGTENLKDVWYGGTKDQWQQIRIEHTGGGNQTLTGAVIHLKDGTTINGPQTEEKLNSAREELAALKPGDPLSLNADLLHYLTPDQTDIVESYLFTWMAEMNFAYRYQGSSEVKRLLMARAGLDPDEDYTKGGGRAVTHITVDTKYGPKSMEVTLETGAPDSGGSLYQNFGKMQYEILEQADLPQSVPKKGWIGRTDYTDMARFIAAVELADLEMLHNTYQWQSLTSELTAGILMDQTVIGIIGAENGSFADGVYTVYKLAVLRYSKKVTIACPVDVRVCDMSGNECGSIINDRVNVSSEHVRMEVQGSTKTVYLTKDDYYINLEGTGSGTMNYTVEEIANDETKRTVQFLQMQLQKDLQYEGYVFEPLGIDSNLYALKALDGSLRVIKPDSDDFQHVFKKIKGLTLNQSGTTLGASKTIRLSAGIYPSDASNQNLKWTVDNGSVASVGSDGLVTALGAGRATITVSTLDGSNLKASCIVVVADDTGGQVNPTSPTGATSPEWKPPGQTGPGKPVTPSGPTMPSGMKPTGPDVTQPTVPVEKPPVGPVVTELYYIVRFDANGGKNLSRKTMTLLKNDSPGILPKVQRSGYYFTGWYTRQDGGSKITGDTVMEGATTLYAGWARVEKPEKVKKLKVKAGKKRIKIRFQKVSGADGYQIVYSGGRKSPAAKAKKTLVRSGSATLKKLKKGTRYAVKVRAYKTDSAKNAVYGPYSKAKHVKVK